MPTYEYTCRDCGHTFDIVQSMWDEPLTMCPECGGSLRKVFAPPAISFKGSGFYATDHGKKAKARSQEKPGDTPGDGKDAGATKDASGKRTRTEKGSGADSRSATETSSKKEPAPS
jgi:putative FmdB family regulatory protein